MSTNPAPTITTDQLDRLRAAAKRAGNLPALQLVDIARGERTDPYLHMHDAMIVCARLLADLDAGVPMVTIALAPASGERTEPESDAQLDRIAQHAIAAADFALATLVDVARGTTRWGSLISPARARALCGELAGELAVDEKIRVLQSQASEDFDLALVVRCGEALDRRDPEHDRARDYVRGVLQERGAGARQAVPVISDVGPDDPRAGVDAAPDA